MTLTNARRREVVGLNPNLLVWAREDAGLTIAEASSELGVSEERLLAFESGHANPTHGQLAKMEKTYQHSRLMFYMGHIPAPGPDAEFREPPMECSPRQAGLIRGLLRQVYVMQIRVNSLLEDEAWEGRYNDRDDREPITAIGNLDDTDFDSLRQRAENHGVFVILKGNLADKFMAIGQRAIEKKTWVDPAVFQGYAIPDDTAPFIIINVHLDKKDYLAVLKNGINQILSGQPGFLTKEDTK